MDHTVPAGVNGSKLERNHALPQEPVKLDLGHRIDRRHRWNDSHHDSRIPGLLVEHPVHHFQFQVSNLHKSATFNGELLGRLGFTKAFETEGIVESQKEGERIIVDQCPKRFLAPWLSSERVGLNHLAFRHRAGEQSTDFFTSNLFPRGLGFSKERLRSGSIMIGPHSVYFEDPDRIKARTSPRSRRPIKRDRWVDSQKKGKRGSTSGGVLV